MRSERLKVETSRKYIGGCRQGIGMLEEGTPTIAWMNVKTKGTENGQFVSD
jgi:hypothetical protein